MESTLKKRIIRSQLPEVFEYSPFSCPEHRWEHLGWDFVNERCSSIKAVARCIYCGQIAYGVRTRNAVGPNSFDLEDEKLIRSGVMGDHYTAWALKHQKRLGII